MHTRDVQKNEQPHGSLLFTVPGWMPSGRPSYPVSQCFHF